MEKQGRAPQLVTRPPKAAASHSLPRGAWLQFGYNLIFNLLWCPEQVSQQKSPLHAVPGQPRPRMSSCNKPGTRSGLCLCLGFTHHAQDETDDLGSWL